MDDSVIDTLVNLQEIDRRNRERTLQIEAFEEQTAELDAEHATKLAEALGAEHINDLPIEYDIAWYEQKAVIVLLALLSLGVKKIRLGPTLPAFLSPNVVKVLVEGYDLRPIASVEEDLAAIIAGI